MNKTHLMSALALAFVLATVSGTNIYAIENTNSEPIVEATDSIEVDVETPIAEVVTVESTVSSGDEVAVLTSTEDAAVTSRATGAGQASSCLMSSELKAAQAAAAAAMKNVDKNSKTYPGVYEYMEKLVNRANVAGPDEQEKLIEALNSAAETANWLFSKPQQQSRESVSTSTGTVARNNNNNNNISMQHEEVKAASIVEADADMIEQPRAELAIARVQDDSAELVSEEIAVLDIDNATTSDVSEGMNDSTESDADEMPTTLEEEGSVDLPNTGEDGEGQPTVNRMVVIVAGIAVVVITLLATVLVVRSKSKRRR